VDTKYKEAIDNLLKAMPDLEGKNKKIETLEASLVKTKQERDKAIADLEVRLKRAEDKIQPVDLMAYDQPKGKIVSADRSGQTVLVNVGSDEYVKPGLTFSVFGVGEYKPDAPSKAKIEITNVVGPHSSMARVTETRSATRYPIITGDQLFNPAWTPGLRDHVAIAGFIDLTGDQKDGTAEFVKALEKQGVIIDAWLDLRDLSIKGATKEVTAKTNFLIMGEQPDLDKQVDLNPNDPRLEKKMSVREAIKKLHDQAREQGVTIVDARKFMALMGMKVPKPLKYQADWTNYTVKPGARKDDDDKGDKGDKPEMKKKEMMKKEEDKEK
jgi:hypothetical protein